ncbi:MAG: hypothetical protein AAGD35_13600 [Actinomycetota bacterium]
MTRWFTSDMHFGHARINELAGRPFASVDEMDAAIVANWTDRVAADDEVWILGDVCMGRIVESLPTLAALPGIKTLVAGNHDRCWEGNGTRKMGRGLDHTGWVDVYLNEGGLAAVHTGNPVRSRSGPRAIGAPPWSTSPTSLTPITATTTGTSASTSRSTLADGSCTVTCTRHGG